MFVFGPPLPDPAEVDEIDVAWLAGLLEGEGTFFQARQADHAHRCSQW